MKGTPEISPVIWLERKVQEQDIEIERLREALKLERQLRDDALRAFNEARAALKEDE
jgi:hypothetical protein